LSFARLTKIAAILALILGVLGTIMGFVVAFELLGPRDVMGPRYLGSTTSGEAIDRGIRYIVIGLLMGTVAEIASVLRKAFP